jgi:hypothetical protein
MSRRGKILSSDIHSYIAFSNVIYRIQISRKEKGKFAIALIKFQETWDG